MPNYGFLCEDCGTVTEEFHKISGRPDGIVCACGGIAHHQISTPAIVGKASFLDGQRRKGWSDLKEASKLNVEAAGTKKQDTKKEIAKEIKKLGVKVSQ